MSAPPPSVSAVKVISPRRHIDRPPTSDFTDIRQPPQSRALEVALARAAAHRQAAQKKAREQSSTIARAQAAIGEELAGLRQEVIRVRRETVGLGGSPARSAVSAATAAETPPANAAAAPRQTPPTHPASLRPSASGDINTSVGSSTLAAQAWDGKDKPETVLSPPQATPPCDAQAQAANDELQRLRKLELSHTAKCAANRDLEHRLAQAEADFREEAAQHTCTSAMLTEVTASFLQSLRQRLPQVVEFHKQAKAALAETGWSKVHTMSTTGEIKLEAEQAVGQLTEDSPLAALINAREKLREYETYVLQMQTTAGRLLDERHGHSKAQTATYEAKVASAELRARHAEEEVERVRLQADAQLARSRDELLQELRSAKGGYEAKLADKQAALREGLQREREALAVDFERQRNDTEAKLVSAERDLARCREQIDDLTHRLARQEARHERDVEVGAEGKLREWVAERQAADAEAEQARTALIENLQVAKERAEGKHKALLEEVAFKEESMQAQLAMDRHRQVEDISKAKSEAQQAFVEAEAEYKRQLALAQRRCEKIERESAQATQLLERRVEQAEMDNTATKLLLTEVQGRCEELQKKLKDVSDEHDDELHARDQQLREAENRLIEVASLQTNANSKTKALATQLLTAEARVASLNDELTAIRIQKNSSADALSDARKHSSDLSEQLSDALKRVLELEQRLDSAQIEVQNAGAKAAMLDGCLAEATTSLAAAEELNRILSQNKSKHEKTAVDAVARAKEIEARCQEVSDLLKEKEVLEASLRERIDKLEKKMREDDETHVACQRKLLDMEREVGELRGELRDIRGITESAAEAEADQKCLREHVSQLAARVHEKELQNVGLRKRLEELEAERMQNEANVKRAEMKVEEMRKSLHTAKLRVPELERAVETTRASLDAQTAQLSQMRTRADARAADAQSAIEKAAMWEGRHKEALTRQAALQRQLAEALSQKSEMQASTATAERDAVAESTKVTELEIMLETTRESLRQEARTTSRLEGQLSEMSAQIVQLEEHLRAANSARDEGQQKLLEARAEYGVLESRLMDARGSERKYMQQLATQDGALAQVKAHRVQLAEVGRELDDRIARLETKLQATVQEKGALGGALVVAESEIAALRATAVRLNDQSAQHLAAYAVQMEEREGRAAAEVNRLEGLWAKSLEDMSSLRLKLEETSIEKHSLVGELEAARQGASSLTAGRQCAEEERDKAIAEVQRLTTKLNSFTNEIANIEQRASDALVSRGEMEGVVASLKKDLALSQENARNAAESLTTHRIQSASEKAQLQSHIGVLAAGLQDLEHQLQVAAARTSGLEDAMRGTEEDAAHAVRMQVPP